MRSPASDPAPSNPAGPTVTARLRRRVPARARRPPAAQARPQGTPPRPPLPSPGTRWRRAAIRSRRRRFSPRDSGAGPRLQQDPTRDTMPFPTSGLGLASPPRLGLGRAGGGAGRRGGGGVWLALRPRPPGVARAQRAHLDITKSFQSVQRQR